MSTAKPSRPTLIKNTHVFDGVHEQLIRNATVLIEGNLYKNTTQL